MIKEFLTGWKVTLKNIFTPGINEGYPEMKRKLPGTFRGRHKLNRYKDGLERCVGCALCAAVCPAEAIYLEAKENDPKNPVSHGERYAEKYEIHLLRCIFCGFCEEACPENAIVMGEDFELANYSRQSLVITKQDMLVSKDKGFGEHPPAAITEKGDDF